MMQYLLPAALIAVTVLLLLLRTNAAVVFFVLCGGYTLVHVSGQDIGLISASFRVSGTTGNLILMAAALLPALVVALFLRASVKTGAILLQLVPALAVALFGAYIILEQLPGSQQASLKSNTYWAQLHANGSPIVLIGVLASVLVVIISLHRRHKDDHKKGKH